MESLNYFPKLNLCLLSLIFNLNECNGFWRENEHWLENGSDELSSYPNRVYVFPNSFTKGMNPSLALPGMGK